MPGRKLVQAITRALRAGTQVVLPAFTLWTQRHAGGNSSGVAAAKIGLFVAFVSLLAGGEDGVVDMLDTAYAMSKTVRGWIDKMAGPRDGMHKVVKLLDSEAAAIRAHRGPNGEKPSDRVSQVFKSRCRVVLAHAIPSLRLRVVILLKIEISVKMC